MSTRSPIRLEIITRRKRGRHAPDWRHKQSSRSGTQQVRGARSLRLAMSWRGLAFKFVAERGCRMNSNGLACSAGASSRPPDLGFNVWPGRGPTASRPAGDLEPSPLKGRRCARGRRSRRQSGPNNHSSLSAIASHWLRANLREAPSAARRPLGPPSSVGSNQGGRPSSRWLAFKDSWPAIIGAARQGEARRGEHETVAAGEQWPASNAKQLDIWRQ